MTTVNMRKTLVLSSGPPPQIQSSQFNASSVHSANFYADRKLYEQFNFFKQEFIKIAMRMDVAIPMDIVEDRSNSLKVFVEYNGPKYVFQIIQSNMASMQLIRPGLSLMVTTLALFKKHLPRNWQGAGNESPAPMWAASKPLTSDEVWASQMIPKLSDSLTVTGCVSILLGTHNPTIQELVINLIAGLITISDDAVTQMLQIPNILYTQTNKKIPTVETSRDKLLQMHMKRLAARLENSLMSNESFADPAIRRSSTQNQSGEDITGGGGGRASTAGSTGAQMRQSLRHLLDRSNSRLSSHRKESSAAVNAIEEARREEELYPEEFSSCLSYILSVALMQKNRHLLLAGCADIIISMTRAADSSLSRFIAQIPTSLLPLIDLQKTANNSRGGHSLKHLYSNQGQHSVEPLHVNPLGAKVIDWAGIRIPLKFLQRYHQIFDTKAAMTSTGTGAATGTLSTASLPAAATTATATAATPSAANDAYSESVKAEYRYAHNRSLLAICSLLVAAHEVVQYTVQLPGAIEVIRLSASIYSDDELHSRPHVTGNNNNNNAMNSSNNNTHKSGLGLSRVNNSNLPGVIVTALNALQLEKQHQLKLKAMLNHSVSHPSDSKSNSRKSSVHSLGLSGGGGSLTTPDPHHPLRPLPSLSGGAGAGNNGSLLSSSSISLMQGAPAVAQTLSKPIQLSSHHEVPFEASFQKETEQYSLYLQNQNDQKIYQRSAASPLQMTASRQLTAFGKGPLQFQNTNQPDPLLATSLQEMEHQTHQTLLQPPNATTSPAKLRLLLQQQQHSSIGLESSSGTWNNNTSSNLQNNNDNAADEERAFLQSAPISPWNHGLSASRDFFGRLPLQPHVPKRIEPKDVIVENESMSRIRKKFQLMGETAVRKIQTSGNEYRNGKNLVSIEERARRVYKPSTSAFFHEENTSHNHNNNKTKKQREEEGEPDAQQRKTLQSLEIFDRFANESAAPPTTTTTGTVSSTAQPTPAWKNVQDLYNTAELTGHASSAAGDYNNNDPEEAVDTFSSTMTNPDAMSLYRVRLDNIEFDEQELFDNFKPIFDFNNPEPDYLTDYPAVLEEDQEGEEKKKKRQQQQQEYGLSSANATMGYNSNYYKLKSSLQADQTPDLLL